MKILGLNLGHNATACLVEDGKVTGCVSEERFSRIKNHYGYPTKAVEHLLNGILPDYIVVDDDYNPNADPYFGKRFQESYTKKSFKNKLLASIACKFPKLFALYYKRKLKKIEKKRKWNIHDIKVYISNKLDFPHDKILTMNHHLAHALSSCFFDMKKKLIFTLDGEGSGLCATLNLWNGKEMKLLSKSSKMASLGYLYGITTIFMGMKPLEHEFKVMGLAPYSKQDKVNEVYNKLKGLIWINKNLEFESKFSMPFFDDYIKRELKFVRFDTMAGAVQKLVEELTCKWVDEAIKRYGVSDIALSGGVFMNVKANQKIHELRAVKSLFVVPSCGDEANAIGAAFYGYKSYCEIYNLEVKPQMITDLYLGPDYDEEYLKILIESLSKTKYKATKFRNINKVIAKLLARGEIVARCSGRSEWGARALGNRSILADAASPGVIQKLNETIKNRDWFMPFTPSILTEDIRRYAINPKKMFAPYMNITFDSTDEAKEEIPAAMHPYDKTIRPQMVTKEHNPDYHEIITEFKKLTGHSGILNTSFNLHGEPNVLTPEDALHTVENSSLKYLVMGNYLFRKEGQ